MVLWEEMTGWVQQRAMCTAGGSAQPVPWGAVIHRTWGTMNAPMSRLQYCWEVTTAFELRQAPQNLVDAQETGAGLQMVVAWQVVERITLGKGHQPTGEAQQFLKQPLRRCIGVAE